MGWQYFTWIFRKNFILSFLISEDNYNKITYNNKRHNKHLSIMMTGYIPRNIQKLLQTFSFRYRYHYYYPPWLVHLEHSSIVYHFFSVLPELNQFGLFLLMLSNTKLGSSLSPFSSSVVSHFSSMSFQMMETVSNF